MDVLQTIGRTGADRAEADDPGDPTEGPEAHEGEAASEVRPTDRPTAVEPTAVEPTSVEPTTDEPYADPTVAKPSPGEPSVDGRSLRRQRNRDAVVEAAFELIGERRRTPTIDEVAERSGLSARSVFRYFDDTDDLIAAVIHRQRRHLEPLWEPGVDPSTPLETRIDRFVAARVAFVNAQGGVAWVARVRATDQPLVSDELARVRAGLRRQVAKLFAPELTALGAEGPAVLAAIDTLTSWESDDLMRRGHGADLTDVAFVMAMSIRRLLAPSAVEHDAAPASATSLVDLTAAIGDRGPAATAGPASAAPPTVAAADGTASAASDLASGSGNRS